MFRILNKLFYPLFVVFLFVIFLVFATVCYFFYKDIKIENATTYSYALFAANALSANILFGLGRSNVFLDQYPNFKIQSLIYRSGVYFLIASFISLCTSGFVYLESNKQIGTIHMQGIFQDLTLIIVSFFLAISTIFSIIGVFTFFRWCYIAFIKFANHYDEDISKENILNEDILMNKKIIK